MKSGEEIQELKSHILETMKSRAHEQNYVIAGGGPTGVELSASFGSYIRHLEKSHKIKRHGVKIWL